MWLAVEAPVRLLQPRHLAVQCAETEVAVGWAGTSQFVSQGDGLLVVSFGQRGFRRILCDNLAKEVQGMRLMAFLVLTGECRRALSEAWPPPK